MTYKTLHVLALRHHLETKNNSLLHSVCGSGIRSGLAWWFVRFQSDVSWCQSHLKAQGGKLGCRIHFQGASLSQLAGWCWPSAGSLSSSYVNFSKWSGLPHSLAAAFQLWASMGKQEGRRKGWPEKMGEGGKIRGRERRRQRQRFEAKQKLYCFYYLALEGTYSHFYHTPLVGTIPSFSPDSRRENIEPFSWWVTFLEVHVRREV